MQQPQTWDLKIVGYLFLAGLGSGTFLVAAGINVWQVGAYSTLARIATLMSVAFVSVGSMLLIGDLGKKVRFWRVFLNPTSSMISVGSWTISLFMLAGLLYFFIPGSKILAWIGMLLAFGISTYTGVLLGVVKARPFWNTPLLPVLFFMSALSSGTALLSLGAEWVAPSMADWLGRWDLVLLILEGGLIFFYLLIMGQSTLTAARSVQEVLYGRWKGWFWVGTVGMGLMLPFLVYLAGGSSSWRQGAAVLVLFGGVCLRYWVLRAGGRNLLPGESYETGLI